MQQALSLPPTDADPSTVERPLSNKKKFMVGGVAALSAAAIAITPTTQGAVEIQSAQSRAYQLTASIDATASPTVVYGQFFNDTFENLSLLGGAIAANPAPILSQVLENQAGYAAQGVGALEAIPASLQAWYDGPNGQARLAQAQAALDAGDLDEAFRWFNHSLLYAFSGAFGPLIAPGFILSGTPRGGTEYLAGIPEQIAQNFTNVIANVFTSTVLVQTLFQGGVAVLGGSVFEITRVIEGISSSLESGDVEGAVNALVNTPAILANAALNGFDYGDVDDPNTPGNDAVTEWPALIHFAVAGPPGSPRVVPGILQQLLVNIPKTIAASIDNSPEVAVTNKLAVEEKVEIKAIEQPAATLGVTADNEGEKELTASTVVDKEEEEVVSGETAETTDTKPASKLAQRAAKVKADAAKVREGINTAVKKVGDDLKKAGENLKKKTTKSDAKSPSTSGSTE